MAEFPYSPHAANVKRFLDHVQKAVVPEKVTLNYLKKVGFSSNDRYILGILKFLGFVDACGMPTKTWTDYRNRQAAGPTPRCSHAPRLNRIGQLQPKSP